MSINISRKNLYDRVWAEPIHRLAGEFGVSDVGLAKICRRYGIPVPPRGYWAKKQTGKRVSQPSCPDEAPKGYGDLITLPGLRKPTAEPAASPPAPSHPLVAAESDPANAISVAEDIRIRHPLLKSTRDYWRIVNRPNFLWNTPLPTHINVGASKEARPRALRLLQALFGALEARGHQISRGDRGQVQVKVLDETCDLFVRERQRRTQKELPKNTAGSAALGAARPFQLVHSGELEFRVEKRYAKQVVRDAPGRPLEEHLNDVVVCLVNAALGEKEFRAAEQRARLAEVERERRQAAFKQQMQARRARFKHLEQLVAAAAHHKQLVAFAAELRDAIGEVNPKSELGRWLGWVEEHVKDSDVLQRFRNGRSSLTLYYCAATYEVDGIIKGGFTGRGPDHDEDQDLPESVAFTDVPMKGIHGGTMCVLIDVPKEAALPYEVFGDDSEYRRFRIPPEIVNQFSRRLYSD